MKKLIAILLSATALAALHINGFACEPVETNGKTLFSNMGNATITIDGKRRTFANSYTANTYTEFQKKSYITEEYDAVSFYLQMSPDAEAANIEDRVRVIFNRMVGENFNPNNTSDRLAQAQKIYTLKNGEDAVHITLPFTYADKNTGEIMHYNNFYVIFTDSTNADKLQNVIMADLKFIKYESKPPAAKIVETDLKSVDGDVYSSVTVEFSQEMDASSAAPDDFIIDGEAVRSVEFDDTGKRAVLICSRLMEFGTDYELIISENVKNLCDNCSFSLEEESRNLSVSFQVPTPMVIGEGYFTDENGDVIHNITSGAVTYTIPLQNKYDLTEGGRSFTLVSAMYLDKKLVRIYYDECTLLPGEAKDLARSISVSTENAPNTEIQTFLWDNVFDMNAFADMGELKP